MKTERYKSIRSHALLLILLFFSLTFAGQAQNHLIIKKSYKSKEHFLTGDHIHLITKTNGVSFDGPIQLIAEDYIILRNQEIPLHNIACIITRRSGFNFRSGGSMIALAGPLYLLIGSINAVLNDIRPIISGTNLLVAGSIIGTGFLMRLLQYKKYKIGEKYQVKIVPSATYNQIIKRNK